MFSFGRQLFYGEFERGNLLIHYRVRPNSPKNFDSLIVFFVLKKGFWSLFQRPSPVVELIERLPSLGLEVSDVGSNPTKAERFLCTRIGYSV